jgi:soluble lytic murein transglycosylase
LFGLLLFVGSLSSCYSGTIWNIKVERFSNDVHTGNFDFLKSIDYSKVDLAQITELGGNAPFYMSYVLKNIGKPVVALRLLELEWRRGDGIWQREAGRRLITYYLRTRQYRKAEELAKRAFSSYPTRNFYRRLLESWYWQHKDEDVLKGLARIAEFKNSDGTPVKDRELALFRAVSSYRLGRTDWQKLFLELFSRQPASPLHIRAWEFFQLEKTMKADFSKTDWDFFVGKYDIAEKHYGPALNVLKPLIDAQNPLLLTPWDLLDLGDAYIGASEPLTGARVYRRFVTLLLADAGSSESLYAAYRTLGELYRAAGYYVHATVAFKRAIGYASNNLEYDRMAWHIIESEISHRPSGAVPEIAKYAKLWHDPSYFNDILGELITGLIQRRDWPVLLTLYHDLDGYADNRIVVRLAYDVASAIDAGYLAIPDGKREASGLLDKVISLDADRYYTFLASARAGKVPQVLRPSDSQRSVQVQSSGENTDWENYVMGFVTYNLLNEAYDTARKKAKVLSNSFLRLVIEQLHKHGKILESLRLMDTLVDRPSVHLSESDLKLYYPQPFKNLIDSVAKKEKLSLPIMYGMVREESYFDADIVSSAGAVGLTQLMPATAKDIARRMGLKDPVITKPSANLAIGAHYLSTLIARFQDAGEALFAYNAGYTRVERWKSFYRGLPDDLFLEAVPFTETQGYVKKILVSAVAYGYIYYGMTPREVVKQMLPTF